MKINYSVAEPRFGDRQRWLAWLTEFSRAEETLQTLSGLFISRDDGPPHAH